MFSSKTLHRVFGILFCSILMNLFVSHLPFLKCTYAEVTLDGTMGVKGRLHGPDYIISDDFGRTRGNNLFHSFGRFNVLTGESATFTGPDGIENIIGRVTGGSQSYIDGLLRSTIEGANLFLLNPYGVLFGANASLDVKGSFHVSTADYLRFSDGGIYYADRRANSVLSVAPVEAFGFLGQNPGGISIQESFLRVPEGEVLSLVGGDIEIAGNSNPNSVSLFAPGGRINIASVASPGEVIPNSPGQTPDLQVESFDGLGNVRMSDGAIVSVRGDGGGAVYIRGGQLTISSEIDKVSRIDAATVGDTDGAEVGIDIQVAHGFSMSGGELSCSSFGAGHAGDIRITAESVDLLGDPSGLNETDIGSRAFATGSGGNIVITANRMQVKNAFLETTTLSSGAAGDIRISADDLEVLDGGGILASTLGGGSGGNLEVSSKDIQLSGENVGSGFTGLTAFTYGPADAGEVRVTTERLQIREGAEISVFTAGPGNAGDLVLNAKDVSLSGGGNPNRATGIFANTFGTGKGGNLTLTADSLEVVDRASLQICAFNLGNAGDALVRAGSLELRNGSFISASAFGSGGNAGTLDLVADSVLIAGLETAADPFGRDFTGISTQSWFGGGKGGDLNLTANSITLTSRASITSSSVSPDAGGNILLNAASLQVLDGSNILASTFGSGDAGNIEVNADSIVVSGVHTEPFTDVTGNIALSPSGIASQTGIQGGKAGAVLIRTKDLQVLDGGRISTETFGSGDSGNIEIDAETMLVAGVNETHKEFLMQYGRDSGGNPLDEARAVRAASAGILAGANSVFLGDAATGNAGSVSIRANDLQIRDHGLIATQTTGPGQGGDIELLTDRVMLSDGALISAESQISPNAGKAGDISISSRELCSIDGSSIKTAAEQAQGGDITIAAQQVNMSNGALISAQSSGPGDAGNIYVMASDTFYSRDSAMTTEAKQADGGNILFDVEYMVRLNDSEISASVGGGPDTEGGNITIDPEFVILKGSRIIANAFEGRGGNIQIVADLFLADPNSVLDASSALGIDGTVDIRAPIANLSGILQPLPRDFMSPSDLLREPCEARIRGGKYSSFVILGRDGLPVEPGDLMASPLE